jgi:hypothetical protein
VAAEGMRRRSTISVVVVLKVIRWAAVTYYYCNVVL